MHQVFALNQFEASSPEEAVRLMVEFIAQYAAEMTYVVVLPDGTRQHINAGDLK